MSAAIAVEAPTRPALRYHGGKFRIAQWVIGHFPAHEAYIEVFGGAASVLLQKPPSKIEVYNDLDRGIVSFFRVLRDPKKAKRLKDLLHLTPFARAEYEDAYESSTDDVEEARRMLVRSFQSIGAKKRCSRNGWRSRVTGHSTAKTWRGWPDEIPAFTERLRDVQLECQPWQKVLQAYDRSDALIYLDPPYVTGTRQMGWENGVYEHEMTDDDHVELCMAARNLKGMVVLSGYDNDIYRELLSDWPTSSIAARAQTNAPRVEMIWINPATAARLQPQLFEVES